MPAVSERQRKFMGAELSRKRRGERTVTGMSDAKLRDFTRKVAQHRGRERRAAKRGT